MTPDNGKEPTIQQLKPRVLALEYPQSVDKEYLEIFGQEFEIDVH
jgi:hypothetical protein